MHSFFKFLLLSLVCSCLASAVPAAEKAEKRQIRHDRFTSYAQYLKDGVTANSISVNDTEINADMTTTGGRHRDKKAVYAHFLGGVAAAMTVSDWVYDITLAKSAHIDGFALNIAAMDPNTSSTVSTAFKAAERAGGFKIYLMFDYAAWGTWEPSDVVQYINQYKRSPAYAQYAGKPLASTFEGPGNAPDWAGIKNQTGCFFIPDWTSLGPDGFKAWLNVTDGAFSWDAWPVGANDMTTGPDEAWSAILGDRNSWRRKPYMMPVSPWFYTNLPQFDKNWVWRGDDMWHQRWKQVIEFQPEIVQIVSWNDYGESHYIGPIRPAGVPEGAWYTEGMDHTGWLTLLPLYIDAYKYGIRNSFGLLPTPDKISYWYKTNPGTACSANGTVGNAPWQEPVAPELVVQDKVFFDVLAWAPADVTVRIGRARPTHLKIWRPGISHFSVPLNNATGDVSISLKRFGRIVKVVQGEKPITTDCVDGNVNWNAFVGSG